jgi:hypothetical protein
VSDLMSKIQDPKIDFEDCTDWIVMPGPVTQSQIERHPSMKERMGRAVRLLRNESLTPCSPLFAHHYHGPLRVEQSFGVNSRMARHRFQLS